MNCADGSPMSRSGPPAVERLVRSRTGRALALVVAVLGLVLVCMALRAGTAEADIYWAAGNGTGPSFHIDRAALDGSNELASFMPSHAANMATDGTYLYWTNFSDTIGRANLDGSNVKESFIPSDGDASGIAIGGGYIFWVGLDGRFGSNSLPTAGVFRAALSDPSVSTEIVTNVPVGAKIATYGGWIYWSASNCQYAPAYPCIARADLNGNNVNLTWRINAFAASLAIDTSGQYIYWSTYNSLSPASANGIYRASLANPNLGSAVVTGIPNIPDVALDASHVYWTLGYSGTYIGRADLDGSSPNSNFIGSAFGAYGIAVDPDTAHTEPVDTQLPGIAGTPKQGLTLSETHGSWSNDAPTVYSYQWLRCTAAGGSCMPIPGATAASYSPDVGDAGATLRVQEVATNPWGTSSPAASAPTSAVQSGVPVTSTHPTVNGSPVEGASLTEAHGLWTSNGAITGYAYQWMRCAAGGTSCAAIRGATQASYSLTAADVGSAIAVTETAVNRYGPSASAQSAATTRVATGVPVDVALPTLVGTPVEGQTLSAVRGVWSNNPSSFAYSWQRCDAGGRSCRRTGRTGTAYRLSPTDIGHTLRVQETAGNQLGIGATATSAPIGPVVDVPVSLQSFALVGLTRAVVPGPVASFSADRAVPFGDYSASVAWGDGSRSVGQIARGPLGTFLVSASHVYRRAGTYSLIVRVASKTGATGQSTNRVSVINEAVCPKRSNNRGRNCLGEIAVPGGCVTQGDVLRVSVPSAGRIAGVTYRVDHDHGATRGTGRRFAAALPTKRLSRGTHKLTATITFRSGHPRTLSRSRSFAVC